MIVTNSQVAAALIHWRRRQGKNVKTMAELLGVAPGALSKIEQGKRPITFCQAVEICSIYGITIKQLLDTATGPPSA